MAQQASTRVVNGITTRVLHGKDYVEVNERLRILNELKRAGEITDFEMVESQAYQIANRWVWRVSAKISGKLYIGNAEIKQDAPKNTPDGTNPIECAETSAFGRMLAFAGLGTIESIASYEEIVRGKPFVAVIEQANGRIVEANAPKQLPQGQQESPAFKDVYLTGGKKGMWANSTEFYASASAILGIPVSGENVRRLDDEQIATLTQAVENEPMKTAASAGGK